MNHCGHLNASFRPGYTRKVLDAKIARLFCLKAFIFKEGKYRLEHRPEAFGQIFNRQKRRKYFLILILSF